VSSPQFGCGLAQCGACSVLLDGKEIRSCVTPVSMAAGKEVITVEGLPARWAKQKNLSAAQADETLHPVQAAWIEEQTPLCGFCQNGMMIKATELLEKTAQPTDAEIKAAFTTSGPSAHLCRCGRDGRALPWSPAALARDPRRVGRRTAAGGIGRRGGRCLRRDRRETDGCRGALRRWKDAHRCSPETKILPNC